jgi:hypothetical protein
MSYMIWIVAVAGILVLRPVRLTRRDLAWTSRHHRGRRQLNGNWIKFSQIHFPRAIRHPKHLESSMPI